MCVLQVQDKAAVSSGMTLTADQRVRIAAQTAFKENNSKFLGKGKASSLYFVSDSLDKCNTEVTLRVCCLLPASLVFCTWSTVSIIKAHFVLLALPAPSLQTYPGYLT